MRPGRQKAVPSRGGAYQINGTGDIQSEGSDLLMGTGKLNSFFCPIPQHEKLSAHSQERHMRLETLHQRCHAITSFESNSSKRSTLISFERFCSPVSRTDCANHCSRARRHLS